MPRADKATQASAVPRHRGIEAQGHKEETVALKWALACLFLFAGFVGAVMVGAFVAELAGIWDLPAAGFSAAIAVVVGAYLAAPSHKILCAAVAFILGTVAAWLLLEPSYYPENYGSLAYEPTHLPIVATYAGGLLGLLAAPLIRRWASLVHKLSETPRT